MSLGSKSRLADKPATDAAGGTYTAFRQSTLDIGTLTEDDAPQACRFTGRNISKEAITVTKVRTTCGCTAAELPAGKILPGETATIVLTYHPKNHPGTIDTDAFVYLSCSENIP